MTKEKTKKTKLTIVLIENDIKVSRPAIEKTFERSGIKVVEWKQETIEE